MVIYGGRSPICQAHSRLAHSTLANMSASPKTACRTLKKSPAGHTDVQDCTGERKNMWKYNVILTTARRWGLPKLQKNVRANRHDDDDDDGDGDGDEMMKMMKMMNMVWLLVPWEWAILKKTRIAVWLIVLLGWDILYHFIPYEHSNWNMLTFSMGVGDSICCIIYLL